MLVADLDTESEVEAVVEVEGVAGSSENLPLVTTSVLVFESGSDQAKFNTEKMGAPNGQQAQQFMNN